MFSLRIWRELGSQKKPNRIPVLRDQKVLPEVRNRSLLVRDLVSYSNSEILLQSTRRTYSFIPSISDIPISLSCSLRSSSNRRLVNSELNLDTRFEIYGSTIGVRNSVRYVPQCQQFNAAIQRKIPTPNLPIKLQLGPIGKLLTTAHSGK